MDARQQRGLEIAARCKIAQKNGTWLVPSQSGHGKYAVFLDPEKPSCTCPDHETRGCKCKHIFAVEYVVQREENPDGTTTVTETISVTETVRKTYPQDWTNYNKAQTHEKEHFQTLLQDLCHGIPEPAQVMGRPRISLSDMVFSATYKVYSTFSGRRFMTDLRDTCDKGCIGQLPHYNSIFRCLEKPTLSPILKDLIVTSSLPLTAMEQDFAVDSSGFSTCRFDRWFDEKYGTPKQKRQWVKAHLICGVKTNVVTAVEILDKDAGDAPQLPDLVNITRRNFAVREVSADKAYASENNFATVLANGGFPYIVFKNNTTGGIGGTFEQMFHYFSLNKEAYLQHYHKRSNVESTFSMIKAKFGDAVRSKTEVAQVNEVLCKILAHNICCLISAMYELGISPAFHEPAKALA